MKKRRALSPGTPAPARLVEAKSMEVPLCEQVYMLDALQEEFRKRGYVPYTRSRIWQLEQAGAFPARVNLGAEKYGRIGWLRVEVDAWFKEKLQNRPGNRWVIPSERSEPELERGVS